MIGGLDLALVLVSVPIAEFDKGAPGFAVDLAKVDAASELGSGQEAGLRQESLSWYESRSGGAALSGGAKIAVISALPANLKLLDDNLTKVKAFTDAGGTSRPGRNQRQRSRRVTFAGWRRARYRATSRSSSSSNASNTK